jgi:[ribosomal protein S18]-alanine N-acetyltransferase
MRKLREPEPVTTHGPFRIRQMTPDDLPAVLEIEKVAFRNPWSPDLLKRELTHDWSIILLAEEPDGQGGYRLLGFAIFWLVHDEVHVLNVAVDPAQRRRGVARAVMEACLDVGRKHRCALATLEVRRNNAAALDLYKAFGFRAVGIRPNYYVDEGEDAIVMVLDL